MAAVLWLLFLTFHPASRSYLLHQEPESYVRRTVNAQFYWPSYLRS